MGNCQSTALKIFVHEMNGHVKIHNFTMKQMKTFRSVGEVFNLINVKLEPEDRIFFNSHIGLEEVTRTATFQIRNLVIKNLKVIKYRIVMEPMY